VSADPGNKGAAQDGKSSAVRLGVDENRILSQRVTDLEHVVADYAQRYGLTELARKTMLKMNVNEAR